MYLPRNASKARVREAENARRNRAEIVKYTAGALVPAKDLKRFQIPIQRAG